MRHGSRKYWLLLTASAMVTGAAASPQSAFAQQAAPRSADAESEAPSDSGEIVVTAQKRTERLVDVPISISAFDQSTMDRRGVKDIGDVAAITPGLTFSSEGLYNRITMRGIATGSHGGEGTGASTTALYIDDIPIQAKIAASGAGVHNSATPKIFDLERVEVLRGPQGTLFGGGAVGGAVRFITPAPSLTDFSGYARAEIADTEGGSLSHEAGVAIGGPIVQDRLGFRISGWYRHDGGYIDQRSTIPGGVNRDNVNNSDSYVVHGALAFAPSDRVRLTPSIFAQDLRADDLGTFNFLNSDVDAGKFLITRPMSDPIRDKFVIPSFKAELELGKITLTSITSYFHRDYSNDLDYTRLFPAALGFPIPTSLDFIETTHARAKQRNFVQELRLNSSDPSSRLQWTAGLYYSHVKQNGHQTIEAPNFPQLVFNSTGQTIQQRFGSGLVDNRYIYVLNVDLVDKELAGYVNIEYKLLDQLSIIGGVRVSHFTEDFNSSSAGPVAGFKTRTGTQKENPVTPKFGINFKPDNDNLFYVSAAKGFRPGGVNNALPSAGAACEAARNALNLSTLTTYDSDSLWSYEVGSKNRLFGGRLSIEASAFHIKWKNIQNPILVPQCVGTFTANLGEAKSDGFDLAVTGRPVRGLTLSLAVGYTNARYSKDSTVNGKPIARKGDQISDASPWQLSGSVEYQFGVTSSVEGYLRVEDRYGSRNDGPFTFLNPASAAYFPANIPNESTNQLDLRAGVTVGGLDLSVFAKNLLNDHPLLSGTRSYPGSEFGSYTLRPRTLGLTGIYRW